MASYADLIRTIEEVKGNVACFRRVVLHAHSPDSYDYQQPVSGNDKLLFEEEIRFINLDMLAITDHMKCDFSCHLSKALASSNIHILPGIEINFRPSPPLNTFKLHIIAIFPENHSVEQVCRFIPAYIPDERNRKGHEEIKDTDLPSFIKGIHDNGGICIAAHIDTDRGIRQAFRQLGHDGIVLYAPDAVLTKEEEKQISEQFKDWILSAGFDAIEVAKETDKEHYRWISHVKGQEVSIPVLLTNDAHFVKDLAKEERITYIKMTSTCFSNLKQALQFPDTRIRFPGDVPKPPSPRILGMEIIAGDDKGFFKKIQIAFSDNLTCLIGPRGSGKSTIIEALRYVFGFNRTLDQIEQPGADLQKKVRGLQEATLTNCIIRIVYCSDGTEPHILEATYNPKQDYATRVYTTDGNERELHDVEASGMYPLRLFGWSELETLGREANRQRELLDKLISGLSEIIEQRNQLISELIKKRKTIESSLSNLAAIMDRNKGEIRRYNEYKADFEKLNTQEVKDLFSELDMARVKELILAKLRGNAQHWLGALDEAVAMDLLEGADELLTESSGKLQSWWDAMKKEMNLAGKQSDIRSGIKKEIDALKFLIHAIDTNAKKIGEEKQEKDKAIRDKVSEEAAKQVAIELRRTAGERLQRVNEIRKGYKDEWKLFEEYLAGWKQIGEKLTEVHRKISEKRAKRKEEIEARLNRFSTTEMAISIKFNADGDKNRFESHIRDSGFLSRDLHGQYKAQHWPEKIAAVCTPVELAEGILEQDIAQLARGVTIDGGLDLKIDEEMANRLITTFYPFGHDDDADVPIVDGGKLMKLLIAAEIEWDDLEGILLNGRPVEYLSPGQRSSAMLPLISLTEHAPLVIDQPEDNLDNRLVGKMLVNILTDLKEKRQIIVATHNPNIVVSGDAEQVIVLEALSYTEGICARSGSIDTPEIVDSVLDLMEGGKEAFLIRQRRYGLD